MWPRSNSRIFLSPLKRLHLISSPSIPCAPWKPLIYFVSRNLLILDSSCKWNHTICGLLCLASFIHILKVHLHSCIFQHLSNRSSLLDWIIIHLGLYHILLTHSSVDGHLCCIHFGVILNNIAVNIHIQVFLWTYVFCSLG